MDNNQESTIHARELRIALIEMALDKPALEGPTSATSEGLTQCIAGAHGHQEKHT